MGDELKTVVLRLAGPLQAWGAKSRFNRRETAMEPTKSGVVGLLAAALGRRRGDPIDDLAKLTVAVRTDWPGTLLRDYHTVSDYRGRPLLSSSVDAKGRQKVTTPNKYTHVTQRFYLQDAVFVVAVAGTAGLVAQLPPALARPAFPLFLGRRSCVPSLPILLGTHGATADIPAADAGLFACAPLDALSMIPWQAELSHPRNAIVRRAVECGHVDLLVTVDDPAGDDVATDVPVSFLPVDRALRERPVRRTWVRVGTPGRTAQPNALPLQNQGCDEQDPFALLR